MQLNAQFRATEQARTRWLQEQGIGSPAARVRAAVFSIYDFPSLGTVVDVGGDGMLLAFLLQGSSTLRGIVADRPALAQKARFNLQEEGVLERCRVNIEHPFTALPPGGNIYVFNRILRKYGDAEAGLLLKNCCQVLSSQSLAVIIEQIVPAERAARRKAHAGASVGGRERTEGELRALLHKAGLHWRRMLPTWADVSVIEVSRATSC